MTSISGKKNIFFITSPRSPYKMKSEIKILVDNFSNQCWSANSALQEKYYRKLSESESFTGSLTGDLALKARDRITRGPKSLGLVDLEPEIKLTEPGSRYISGEFSSEDFTRQLLKFQFPSPFHKDNDNSFFIKPYLELIRLVFELDGLSKDEIAAFVMQLTRIEKYQLIKQKILDFRKLLKGHDKNKSSYKKIFDDVFTKEIIALYSNELKHGETKTRQSNDESPEKFIKTKKSNHKDYADAAIRYLRETKLFSLGSSRSRKIKIDKNKIEEVKYIIDNVTREPIYFSDELDYKKYLFNSSIPQLLSDNKKALVNAIRNLTNIYPLIELKNKSIYDLKLIKQNIFNDKLTNIINEQRAELETYKCFQDICDVFKDIQSRDILDPSLFMEWNTWRAFVMLDDGDIKGNFGLDDEGMPLSNAPGNMSDIICKYNDFDLTIEVTLSTGATQYIMEGEPVPRHLGNHRKQTSKECYSIFISPKINEATIAHFFMLFRTDISYYGGIAKIIPLNLSEFIKMINIAYKKDKKPTAHHIGHFVKSASDSALKSKNETEWYFSIQNLVDTWV